MTLDTPPSSSLLQNPKSRGTVLVFDEISNIRTVPLRFFRDVGDAVPYKDFRDHSGTPGLHVGFCKGTGRSKLSTY